MSRRRRYKVVASSPRWTEPKVVLATNSGNDAFRRFVLMRSRKQPDVVIELHDGDTVTHTAA